MKKIKVLFKGTQTPIKINWSNLTDEGFLERAL